MTPGLGYLCSSISAPLEDGGTMFNIGTSLSSTSSYKILYTVKKFYKKNIVRFIFLCQSGSYYGNKKLIKINPNFFHFTRAEDLPLVSESIAVTQTFAQKSFNITLQIKLSIKYNSFEKKEKNSCCSLNSKSFPNFCGK